MAFVRWEKVGIFLTEWGPYGGYWHQWCFANRPLHILNCLLKVLEMGGVNIRWTNWCLDFEGCYGYWKGLRTYIKEGTCIILWDNATRLASESGKKSMVTLNYFLQANVLHCHSALLKEGLGNTKSLELDWYCLRIVQADTCSILRITFLPCRGSKMSVGKKKSHKHRLYFHLSSTHCEKLRQLNATFYTGHCGQWTMQLWYRPGLPSC